MLLTYQKIIEKEQGKESAKKYLNTITSNKNIKNKDINIDYITKQIEIVRNLQSVCS